MVNEHNIIQENTSLQNKQEPLTEVNDKWQKKTEGENLLQLFMTYFHLNVQNDSFYSRSRRPVYSNYRLNISYSFL